MALETPTIAEISDGIVAQLEATLNQSIPLLPKSFIRVLARVLGGVFILGYKYAGFGFLQMFIATATNEPIEVLGKIIKPLTEWGRQIGVGDPDPGTQAELTVDIIVETQIGSLLAGTQLINGGNGVTYITLGTVLLDAPTVQAQVRAVSDQNDQGGVGAIGNLDNGSILNFANPLANVNREATVVGTVVTGANPEDLEVYRQRVLDRWQKRQQGGAYADYEIWGEEAAGIINLFPYTGDVPGEVDVYSEATPESSGDPDGIPTPAQLQAVFDIIEFDQDGLATRRPAGAFVNSLPITRRAFDVTIQGLTTDNVGQTQDNITEGIEEYFIARNPFIDGLAITNTSRITRSALAGIVDNIAGADNGFFTGLTLEFSGFAGDLEAYVLQKGEKAKALNVVFIP